VAADHASVLDLGAQEFVDLDHDAPEDVGGVDVVFDVIGGDIQRRSASLVRAGGRWCPSWAHPRRGPRTVSPSTSSSSPIGPSGVRSSSACATDGCAPTPATSSGSTARSPPSTERASHGEDDRSRPGAPGTAERRARPGMIRADPGGQEINLPAAPSPL